MIAVTGAAAGIGAAIAHRLATEGAIVAVGDLNLPGAEQVADAIGTAGGTAVARLVDVSIESAVKDFLHATAEAYGKLDGLVNNAADVSAATIGADTDAVTTPDHVWQRALAVNLTGSLYAIRHAVPLMLERGRGSIVNIASEAAFRGEPTRMAYAVSKAGQVALSRNTASRWGRQGIRSNVIAPGLIATDAIQRNLTEETRNEILAASASSRLGEPDDIAALTAHLLSGDGAFGSTEESASPDTRVPLAGPGTLFPDPTRSSGTRIQMHDPVIVIPASSHAASSWSSNPRS